MLLIMVKLNKNIKKRIQKGNKFVKNGVDKNSFSGYDREESNCRTWSTKTKKII